MKTITEPKNSIGTILKNLEDGGGIVKLSVSLDQENTEICEEFFKGYASKIGTLLPQNEKGDLILSVRNAGFARQDPRTRGPNTNRQLSFHTDRCDVIGFLCLRSAKSGGENQIVSSVEVDRIIQAERPDLHKTLYSHFPYKRHTVDGGNPNPYCMQPIFSRCQGFFACAYLRVLIDRADHDPDCPKLSDQQREAINFLDEVCERPQLQERMILERGQMLFLNNWTTLHRRTAFDDYGEDHLKRHFLRIWLSVSNSRPLDIAFKQNYGSVEAGAIRGGMNPKV